MILYHGSNIGVLKPKIIYSNRALDFGTGFYLTSDYNQTQKWAKLITKRRGNGKPSVSVYEIKDDDLEKLKILKFDNASYDWLDFISKNRKKKIIENNYDVVIGPVANDNTLPVINLYLEDVYSKEEALKRLLPQKLKDQVVFKSGKAIKYLKVLEVKEI